MAIDGVLFILAIAGAFALRFNSTLMYEYIFKYSWRILLLLVLKIIIFNLKGMYRPILRYTGLEFLSTAGAAVLYSSGTQVLLAYLQGSWPLPRSVLIIDALLTIVLVVGVRLIILWLFRQVKYSFNGNKTPERFAIYGAGVAGSQLARALIHEPNYRLVAFIDDKKELRQQGIMGVRVYAPADLPKLLATQPLDTVILAMPTINRTRKRQIINQLQSLGIFVKTIPTPAEILSNQVAISEIRNIDVAELLGREEVMPNPELLRQNVTGKSVLVTGAGGSIGSELCRQIAQLRPKILILYEISEYSLYSIDLELGENYPKLKKVAYLGNVTDQIHLMSVLRRHQIETIYHAAAYKHVPLVEANPAQGVYNNVFGTLTVALAARLCGVSNFVLVSTDKAVRPTNIMGASKRVAELVVQGLADIPETKTCFAIVRFGNVLDSSGSVVPRFRKQIAEGKPITVTHRDVTRYFMSIPEAVRLVMQAGAMAMGGEVFLLDMGEPIRIYDLAVQMIRLSGLEPGRDIEIEITGLRPGEKLYEELLIDGENIRPTKHPKIFSAHEQLRSWETLQPLLEELLEAARINNNDALVSKIKELVPEYQPQKCAIATQQLQN
ncbi:MAG: polysaccharide biosynthesis protein [Gomphosphaeria aponina SAG 52.96 = DSM 107014]|uniref:Polysaccharide biosynthesis protein n=1 Tax=Gomphosphaeria aponina SAG 52.96 = DSM 107014 TaxID=1521640 RepID=A0A941GTU0_9CHRO|nr:polysaccharide biosynthesis protein [Gomphosphaeria aponina SAG 52.96 = DSM 107014]